MNRWRAPAALQSWSFHLFSSMKRFHMAQRIKNRGKTVASRGCGALITYLVIETETIFKSFSCFLSRTKRIRRLGGARIDSRLFYPYRYQIREVHFRPLSSCVPRCQGPHFAVLTLVTVTRENTLSGQRHSAELWGNARKWGSKVGNKKAKEVYDAKNMSTVACN